MLGTHPHCSCCQVRICGASQLHATESVGPPDIAAAPNLSWVPASSRCMLTPAASSGKP